MTRRTRILAAGLVLVAAASCDGVRADSGADAYMQIPGRQFVRGPMPTGSPSGPVVEKMLLQNANIWPGLADFAIGADLGPTATSAAVGLRGDVGYWIVPAGSPNYLTPTYPLLGTTALFSLGIVPGTYTLVVQAVDQRGNYGPQATQILYEEPNPLNGPAKGDLVITLTWDTESNLSLHVVVPGGEEIYWGNQSTEPPFSFDQEDGGSYGYIDYDSNANCEIDGLRREDALWPNPPPPGQYTVRVDAPSLCGQPEANWVVKVVLDGKQIGEASGVALEADTWGSHGAGSGVPALQFTVP